MNRALEPITNNPQARMRVSEALLSRAQEMVLPTLGSVLRPSQIGSLSFHDWESCGVVIEDASGLVLVQLQNHHREPAHDFQINGSDVADLEDLGFNVTGVWHTHPPDSDGSGPRPSSTDLDYHPLSLRMFLVFRGIVREFDNDGKELDAWRTYVAEEG